MTIACKAFIRRGKTALFLLDDCIIDGKKVPCWDLPGGKQEIGETFEQTIRREVKEETGLDVAVKGLFGECVIVTSKGAMSCLVFEAEAKAGAIDLSGNPARGERIEAYRWMRKEESEKELVRPGIDEVLTARAW